MQRSCIASIHLVQESIANVLLVHATGFHGRVWGKDMIESFVKRRMNVVSIDLLGHGSHTTSTDRPTFDMFRSNVLDTLQRVRSPVPWVGFGHSFGGAILLSIEALYPGTFSSLAVFEPVIISPSKGEPSDFMERQALRRRDSFASYEVARANFAGKPPMDSFAAECVEKYVQFGLKEGGEDGSLQLACRPHFEASVYHLAEEDRSNEALMPRVKCPTLLMAGTKPLELVGKRQRQFVREELSEGHSGLITVAVNLSKMLPQAVFCHAPHLGHFGPLEDPALVGEEVAAFFSKHLIKSKL